MKLEDLKRLAAARTKGEWRWIDDEMGAVNEDGGFDVIIKTDSHVYPPDEHDAKWIAAINNAADKLLAVVEAAEAVCLDWDFEGGGVTNGLHIELNEALAALEEG